MKISRLSINLRIVTLLLLFGCGLLLIPGKPALTAPDEIATIDAQSVSSLDGSFDDYREVRTSNGYDGHVLPFSEFAKLGVTQAGQIGVKIRILRTPPILSADAQLFITATVRGVTDKNTKKVGITFNQISATDENGKEICDSVITDCSDDLRTVDVAFLSKPQDVNFVPEAGDTFLCQDLDCNGADKDDPRCTLCQRKCAVQAPGPLLRGPVDKVFRLSPSDAARLQELIDDPAIKDEDLILGSGFTDFTQGVCVQFIRLPALEGTTVGVENAQDCLSPGSTVRLTAQVSNPLNSTQTFNFSSVLPQELIPLTCTATTGDCNVDASLNIAWSGSLAPGQIATITYQARVADSALAGRDYCIYSTTEVDQGCLIETGNQDSECDSRVVGAGSDTVLGSQTATNCLRVTCSQRKCSTVCFQSPYYYLLRYDRWFGMEASQAILIGGHNLNQPVSVGASRDVIFFVLRGGFYPQPDSRLFPLQYLNRHFVAAQLSLILSAGGNGSPAAFDKLWGTLDCYGVNFAAVTLSNGVTISQSSMLKALFYEAQSAIRENRQNDMVKIGSVLAALNGDSLAGGCAN